MSAGAPVDSGRKPLLGTLRAVVPMVFKASPAFFMLFAFVALLHGVSWGAIVLATQRFFDAVELAVTHGATVSNALVPLLVLALVTIGFEIVNALHSFVYTPFNQCCIGYLTQRVHVKVAHIDPVVYENPTVLDAINKSGEGIRNVFGMVFTFIMVLTFFLPYVIFMELYLLSFEPLLALAALGLFVPAGVSYFAKTKLFAKLEDEAAPVRRRFDYYEQCICGREYLKETRILGAFRSFDGLYRSTLALLNGKLMEAERRTFYVELGTKVVTLAGYLGVLYLLVASVLADRISVGAFAAVFASLAKMVEMIGSLVAVSGGTGRNLGSVRNLLAFLGMPERRGEEREVDFGAGITAEKVSFRYPAATQDSLREICMDVSPGETIAIVGENGAGKTTLVRLLTGLYLPGSGAVRIGGVDTAKLSPESAFGGVSAVLQSFQRYRMSLRDNVRISDMRAEARDEQVGSSIKKADIALDTASFPEGLDTMLSRDFDGVELSGGQWQRVAIARGLFRSHQIIVLDEPTAAIDPLEETRIYNDFSELCHGKIAILVTHRMGSARIARRIVVMDKGRIVETGSHDELVAKRGKYYEMFSAQAQWYDGGPRSQE